MLAAAMLIALAQAPAATVDGPVVMTGKQIAEYNAGLNRTDPAYIRCVRTLEIGSLVKKTRQCRTNAEWKRVVDITSQDARDTTERMQSGAWRSSDDPPPTGG